MVGGFQTCLPRILLRKRRRDKWSRVAEALFPCYLFIQVDTTRQSIAPVRSTVGGARLVCFGHNLKPVPDSVIDYLREVEDTSSHQHYAVDWPHKPGDAVQVLTGPFAGLTGVFHVASDEARAAVNRVFGPSE